MARSARIGAILALLALLGNGCGPDTAQPVVPSVPHPAVYEMPGGGDKTTTFNILFLSAGFSALELTTASTSIV